MNSDREKSGTKRTFLYVLTIVVIVFMIIFTGMFFKIRKEYSEYEREVIEEMNTIVGKEAPDFTVQLEDGTETTLYKLLDEKEVLVLNVFATWCGPCKTEFPEMEKVYQKYGDRMEILAVSASNTDKLKDILNFKKEFGLSFPMGLTAESVSILNVLSYPTTYVIDRNGRICFYQSGFFANDDLFEKVVTAFMGYDYHQKQVALYSFIVIDRKNNIVPDAQLILKSDVVEEVLTTDENGTAFYFTENPEKIDIMVLSLPGSYGVEDGVIATTNGPLSGWIPITVE